MRMYNLCCVVTQRVHRVIKCIRHSRSLGTKPKKKKNSTEAHRPIITPSCIITPNILSSVPSIPTQSRGTPIAIAPGMSKNTTPAEPAESVTAALHELRKFNELVLPSSCFAVDLSTPRLKLSHKDYEDLGRLLKTDVKLWTFVNSRIR